MKPTYYSCHMNPKNNSIYFITNKHRDGWCIPACRPSKEKKDSSIIDHKKQICETEYKYFEKQK
jgi:hypothetical protein